jgi:hypothetical protein
MTEEEFRQKYPHSTDEQVRLYCEAVAAEMAGFKPPVEPDIPMPMITVPAPRRITPSVAPVTTYAAGNFFVRNFSLADVPPEAEPADCAAEMREILLGQYGFNAGLSPEARQRLAETDMTEGEMLALLVGAPSAREFASLA